MDTEDEHKLDDINLRTTGTNFVVAVALGVAMRLRTFSSASSQSSPLTPCSFKSSLSPGSPGFLNSPHSSPAGPDTTEFQEFIASSRKLLERDFSALTLTGELTFLKFVLCMKL